MDDQLLKIQRSTRVIKVFMVLVVVLQIFEHYDSNIWDLGSLAGLVGTLSLFRALLLSPHLLARPFQQWFEKETGFTAASKKYLWIGGFFILIASF